MKDALRRLGARHRIALSPPRTLLERAFPIPPEPARAGGLAEVVIDVAEALVRGAK
jgi:hypothetical protein